MFKKIGIFIGALAGILYAGYAGATTTVSTIASELSPVLSETVQAMISVFISFVTTNLPLIVVLGVTVGLVFWLIRKARGALSGR